MLQSLDLTQVKQYNASLKQYRDKAANLNAEIEYTNKELDTLCKELSTELGIEVTRDNIEQIYNEQLEKINSTLQSGNAVLAKIASEEQRLAQPQPVQTPVQTPVQPVQPVASPVQPVQPASPVFSNAVNTQTPVAPVPPSPGTIFGNAQNMPQDLPNMGTQQPLFNLG